MRVLTGCDSKATLLPTVNTLYMEIRSWYDDLPPNAKANELFQSPWEDSMVCLGYIHLGHLGALTLIMRKTFSIYRPDIGVQKRPLQPAERAQLAIILNDGIVAAKQSSRILYLFLGEQASIRHCWSVMYVHNRPIPSPYHPPQKLTSNTATRPSSPQQYSSTASVKCNCTTTPTPNGSPTSAW